jgi:predicted phosphohydrolase
MNIFAGWENHIEKLEINWNKTVGEGDAVVVAGDISWASVIGRAKKDFAFVHERLNGVKIFIKGNHDYWWTTRAKMDRFLADNGFDSIRILHNDAYIIGETAVCGSRGWIGEDGEEPDRKILKREAGRLEASIKNGLSKTGEAVVFLHYPPVYENEENAYILDVLRKYAVKRCYYGHIHGGGAKNAFTGEKYGIRFGIITADSAGFTPVLIKK